LVDQRLERKEVISSGFVVMGLTLALFVGFFLRDIMMARTFGLGATLDNFYIALLIPMFLVTALCMPLGTVFVPIYLDIKGQASSKVANNFVSGVSFWMVVCLLIICFMLYIIGPILIPYFYHGESSPDMSQLIPLYNLTLLIFLFGGVIILGNSILNANGRADLSGAAQLIVPVIAILALLFFGRSYGVKAVMYGMVVGQLFNLLIVHYCLRRYSISLRPRLVSHRNTELYSLFLQYFPLVISTFFVAIVAPVATLLAISLPEGGVSAFNLGNKVTLFVTSLVGTAISAVILPYFSVLVSRDNLISARRELSFFLLLTTFISVPISICFYYWSEPMVRLVFEGGTLNNTSTELVARVMQYAIIQLPFFICNSLLLKFAVATKHVFAISMVAFVGLLVNIGSSILLMKHMGVAGIALGATVSMLFSSALLVLILVRYWHITEFDALILFLNWLLFVTLLLCLHFQSFASAYITLFAYGILLATYFYSLKTDKV
jgi:putative peptidoglycan lipid II flippase